MQNPFTTTFSKTPEYTYITTEQIGEIMANFSYDKPSESVYKITGVRGSGKTVILAKIENELRGDEYNSDWMVFDITPTRSLLKQIAAMLHKQGYAEQTGRLSSVSVSANVMNVGGSLGFERNSNHDYYDIGVDLETMLQNVAKANKKILIGIDEVSRTPEMIEFASEYGKWLRADYPVYLVCTGLYENIQALSNVSNLTFFRRATTIKTEPLSFIRMTEMYKSKLGVDYDTAKEMARITKGYAYAFQTLGSLYFNKNENETNEEIIAKLRTELFAYSYEKIWEEMSQTDRLLASLMTGKDEYKREELLVLLGNKANSYSVYRDRLLKRGIISSRAGYISLALPFFADYIKDYCMDCGSPGTV